MTWLTVIVFLLFVGVTLGISFWFGAKARSAHGYFAAGGQIPWFVNGVAFAGDYLSAASFLGICGMIAIAGYDGFLYSIGYLAGWIVALFVIAEPIRRMGKYTFADALDSRFQSRGIRLSAAVSTLVISIFYLIPQMVGAGSLIKPLLGLPHSMGVIIVGVTVVIIVVTAGMVSTTYVQFIKGTLLVVFSLILTICILMRGLQVNEQPQTVAVKTDPQTKKGEMFIDGKPADFGSEDGRLRPVVKLPGAVKETGPLSPWGYLQAIQGSEILLWSKGATSTDASGTQITNFVGTPTPGEKILRPGNHTLFKGIRDESGSLYPRLNFISLMLALFAGTASLPHILIRYYTVKDQTAARKSTIVGIASIGAFYILTLYLGLGAMTNGTINLTDTNMAAPLLARSFNEFLFAIISAIAFTTVLGTVSGLIVAASGAVVHDLLNIFRREPLTDHEKVVIGKWAAVGVGVIAIGLGIVFAEFNATFLVGWAFSVAASANLPALVMALFWKRTTKQGITAAVIAGMVSSLAWVLASDDACEKIYHISKESALVPFSQPGIVTIPLGFIVLIAVSLLTRPQNNS
jgi:cation/acetate symporter